MNPFKRPPPPAADGAGVTVLVADDERNIRLVLRTALETDGHRVVEAGDGRQALDCVARDRPALLLLDLNMPVMDGRAVLARLRERADPADPAVVVLTAHGDVPRAVEAVRLGAADFLVKPVTPDALRAAVTAALTSRAAPRLMTR